MMDGWGAWGWFGMVGVGLLFWGLVIWFIVTINMLITSMSWFNDLADSYSNYAPTFVLIASILGFGLFYLYFITAIEQHTHGDASDR